MTEYTECESRDLCDEARHSLAAAQDEIERLRAALKRIAEFKMDDDDRDDADTCAEIALAALMG